MSPFWDRAWRVFYWVVTRMQPVIRPVAVRVGVGNVVELEVKGWRTGQRRRVLLGLLRVDGGWYLGHPNGEANWTRSLDAVGSVETAVAVGAVVTAVAATASSTARTGRAGAMLRFARQEPVGIRVELLPVGDERRRVIQATWRQHVFPGAILYWLARRHVFAVGRYYRVELAP